MSLILFGGSRALAPDQFPLAEVVARIQDDGQVVRVGCAIGADRLVIQAAIRQPGLLSVFAAFSRSGSGAWAGSAVEAVRQAEAAGAQVEYLAGGALNVPLVGRLMGRSRVAAAGCAASVFFLSSPSSRGSLAVAGMAATWRQPVFAFCADVPQSPRAMVGRWFPSRFADFPCWRWQPAQSGFSRF